MNKTKIIAIPIMNKSSEHKISKLFARSKYFLIFDEKNHQTFYLANEFIDSQIKSGKSIAKALVARGVNVFCGYEIGFNVQKIAEENNIQIILLPETKQMSAKNVINLMKNK
jgi:predicted Fe-Mo cluster-binding NifX family protein